MDGAFKPKTAADVDKVVSAEIPTGEADRDLRGIVERCMSHGPCGILNPNCSCMFAGVCTKHFPKEFQDETMWNDKGYPRYRRREKVDGVAVKHSDGVRDNRWVVPYNRELLLTFRCHINVEVCTSIKAVKYLYKSIPIIPTFLGHFSA